jgi:hypothetical protein
MMATQTVFVAAGSVSEALLEMKVEAVAQSTTVTASADAARAQEAAGTHTVGESAVRDMPNTNEGFEIDVNNDTVPGATVVHGHLNLKIKQLNIAKNGARYVRSNSKNWNKAHDNAPGIQM